LACLFDFFPTSWYKKTELSAVVSKLHLGILYKYIPVTVFQIQCHGLSLSPSSFQFVVSAVLSYGTMF